MFVWGRLAIWRIGNPPAEVQSALEVLESASGRRISNPPQVANLPHMHQHQEDLCTAID